MALDIAIVGGSMAGLFAGLGLLRAGHDVHIYERSATPLAGRGAGIVTHRRLHEALVAVGLATDPTLGVAVRRRCILDAGGSLVDELSFPQINTSWDRLFGRLREAYPNARYHAGKALVALADRDDGVTLTFTDGSQTAADLVIGADGIRSSVRAHILPTVAPRYAGYVAWRALVDEDLLSTATRKALANVFAFCLPPGEQALVYGVAGRGNAITTGNLSFNLVWYRPADSDSALQDLLTDEAGHCHATGIPPTLIRRDVLAEARARADGLLAPAFAEIMARCPQPMLQPIYDLAVPRMTGGRVALIGDAAFVARPHVGAGVTKAGEDAVALCASLSGVSDVAAALEVFDMERRLVGDRVIAQARLLGAGIGTDRAAADRRAAHVLMRDTASLAFLD